MPRNVYIIENLDCANCAAKIEKKFNDHPAVQEAVITFSTEQLRLTAEDPDSLLPQIMAEARKIEADVQIRPREQGHPAHHQRPACGFCLSVHVCQRQVQADS